MSKKSKSGLNLFLLASAMVVVAIMVWQAISQSGAPDPQGQPKAVALLNISLLVFREGLECILVLAAIMANMTGPKLHYRKPVTAGAGVGFLASIASWFIAVAIINDLMESVPALHLQAATGLLAIVVLLIVMNWFFHKVYWGGWISLHNKKKRELMSSDQNASISHGKLLFGLGLLGFSSMYREGFEIVLFLQSYRLKMGSGIVAGGAAFGLYLTAIVAILTFIAHQKLPYRKMLVFTGVMLAVVLMVMVGEQVQEMQLAGWLPVTELPALDKVIPGWVNMWFAIFPNAEGLTLQMLAMALVGGSYFAARKAGARKDAAAHEEEDMAAAGARILQGEA